MNILMYYDLLKVNLNEIIIIIVYEILRIGEIVELVYSVKGFNFSYILFKEEFEYNFIKVYDIMNILFKLKLIILLIEVV